MKHLNQKIGFIGCGNMGSAIVKGLVSHKIVSAKQIFVFDADSSKLNSVSKKFRVRKAASNRDLVQKCGIILLAVKPQEFSKMAREIRFELGPEHTVISILAGTTISKIKKSLNSRCRISRAMPNLGAVVGEAITVVTSTNTVAASTATTIFSGCGKVIKLNERYFDLVTAVSGSGPAYFFLLTELLSQAAQRGGLSKDSADLLAIQTAIGSAQLTKTSTKRPGELRKMVTSKKGTTDAALTYLSKKGFAQIFIQAIQQAERRAKQLSQLS